MDLSVQIETRGTWAVASVYGDVDVATAPRLREQLVSLVTSGQTQVILDLDGVGFMDSTGLGVVIGILKRARTHGGDLRLVATRSNLVSLFELTGLDRTLPLAKSVDAALADAGAGAGAATE
ncbi:MAG: STAS domain-containing protein [Actinomycetota bacterium]|nr:STAS domain-containing protein [Actinomycetota bacterium]